MSDNSIRDGKPGLLSIALLWMASRALPLYWVFSQLERKFDFEVPQVKKILEYGFWARKGAMINTDFVTGLSVNPGNYVNHPFPIIWLYTLLYRLGGEVAIYIFLAVVGLVSCLLVYVVLRRYFSQPSAWFAAALFTVAQGAIEFDLNTDVVAFGTVVWLFVMLVVSRAHRAGRALTTGELWLLAAGVFAGGQISWFTLTTVPALMIFSLPPGVKLTEAIRKPLRIAPWRPLLIGGVATALVFLLQIVLYSSSAHGDSDYVKEQLGLTSISRWKSFPVIVVRMLLAGPALWFGAILALFKMRVLLKSNRLFLGAAAYLPTFIGVCLVLPGLLSRNQHAFRYNLFPCAILTAFVLESIRWRGLKIVLTGLAVLGLAVCYAKVQVVNKASLAAFTLGKWIAQNSAPTEVILFNWNKAIPPVRSYDVEFGSRIGYAADRMVRVAVNDELALMKAAKPMLTNQVSFLFLRETRQPLSEAMEKILAQHAELRARASLPVAPEATPVYKILRQRLYSWTSKGVTVDNELSPNTETNAFSLELYRLDPEIFSSASKLPEKPRD